MAVSSATGGNIDVASIVEQLMTIERRPLAALSTREASYQSKISAFGTVKSALSAFQTAARTLSDLSATPSNTAASSNSTMFGVTASSAAAVGTHSIEIGNLAQAQKLAAAGQLDTTTAIGVGTLTFDFGTTSGGVFTSGGAGTKTVDIDGSNNTLQGIRDAINSANVGVTANIVNDGSGTPYRLTLSSNTTGLSNSMQISVTGDTALSDLLNYDPNGAMNMAQTAAALDASLIIDGISVSKGSNTVSDVIDGVTLSLLKETTTAETIEVKRDTAAIKTAVEGFAKAYSDLNKTITDLTAYNTTTRKAAALQGDSVIRGIQAQLRNIMGSSVATGGTLTTLSQIGLSPQKDGSLTVDSTKLTAALDNNFGDFSALLSAPQGYAYNFNQFVSTTLGFEGAFTGRTEGLTNSIRDLGKQRDAINTRLVTVEARYRRQFAALDGMLSSMNQTSSYLTQQLSKL
ncbi:MAG: flagellar filament capping protein FliD [Gallionella sp.]|nr:flagellar filament capping protein FliD [Gallionella sp.]